MEKPNCPYCESANTDLVSAHNTETDDPAFRYECNDCGAHTEWVDDPNSKARWSEAA